MRAPIVWISALALVFAAGCERGKSITPPTNVTLIKITGSNMRFIKRIDDDGQIAALLKFVSEHRSGWTQPMAGVPVASYYAYFYDGDKVLGHFAVGGGFFETDLAGDFFRSREATKSETDAFLALIGLQGARL
jgi:hypothetical protein